MTVGRWYPPLPSTGMLGKKCPPAIHFCCSIVIQANRITGSGPPNGDESVQIKAHCHTAYGTNKEDAVSVTARVLKVSWGYRIFCVNITEKRVHEGQ